jgi:hypothetical protein
MDKTALSTSSECWINTTKCAPQGPYCPESQFFTVREVTTFGEHITSANRRYHRAGNDGPDTGHADQPFAARVLARDGYDLFRQTLDALVEPAPVAGQIFNDVHYAWQ